MTTAREVRDAAVARIETMLGRANGRRRERLLSMSSVMSCLRDVVEGCEYSGHNGGTVANAYNYPATTTHVMAARVEGRVFLGITTSDAKSASPGRAFCALQPWRKGEGPRGASAAKWLAFSQSPGVIELSAPEIDAILEVEAGIA